MFQKCQNDGESLGRCHVCVPPKYDPIPAVQVGRSPRCRESGSRGGVLSGVPAVRFRVACTPYLRPGGSESQPARRTPSREHDRGSETATEAKSEPRTSSTSDERPTPQPSPLTPYPLAGTYVPGLTVMRYEPSRTARLALDAPPNSLQLDIRTDSRTRPTLLYLTRFLYFWRYPHPRDPPSCPPPLRPLPLLLNIRLQEMQRTATFGA